MADPVAFHCIEKEYLIRFGDGLVLSDMPNVDTAIRKHELRGNSALFRALISTSSPAVCIPYGDDRGPQKSVNVKLRQMFVFFLDAHDSSLDRHQSIASRSTCGTRRVHPLAAILFRCWQAEEIAKTPLPANCFKNELLGFTAGPCEGTDDIIAGRAHQWN